MHDDATKAANDLRDYNQKVQEDNYIEVQKPINDLAETVAKYGAPKSVRAAVAGAKTYAEAVQAAAGYANDPTSDAGQYSAYLAKGGKATAGDFLAAKEYSKELEKGRAQAANAYSIAYNTASGKSQADMENTTKTNAQQDKLEAKYTASLEKAFTGGRTGPLGIESAKVNQALHMKALFDQYKQPDGTYNVYQAQYAELASGLANIVSNSSVGTESQRKDIASKTAKGDFNAVVQYLGGKPQNGNTQAIIKNLIDSIDRQGKQAEQNRDTVIQGVKDMYPTGLDPVRKARIDAAHLPSYSHPENNVQSPEDVLKTANDSIATFYSGSDTNKKAIDALHKAFPNATSIDIYKKLKDKGYIQ